MMVNINDKVFSLIPGPDKIDGIADSQYVEITEHNVDEIFNCPTKCYHQDILDLCEYLKTHFPATWLHDEDSNVYSLEAFKNILQKR